MRNLLAILLDNDYYGFLSSGRQEIDGIPMVGAAQLIGQTLPGAFKKQRKPVNATR